LGLVTAEGLKQAFSSPKLGAVQPGLPLLKTIYSKAERVRATRKKARVAEEGGPRLKSKALQAGRDLIKAERMKLFDKLQTTSGRFKA
jgi:hypothetical protein